MPNPTLASEDRSRDVATKVIAASRDALPPGPAPATPLTCTPIRETNVSTPTHDGFAKTEVEHPMCSDGNISVTGIQITALRRRRTAAYVHGEFKQAEHDLGVIGQIVEDHYLDAGEDDIFYDPPGETTALERVPSGAYDLMLVGADRDELESRPAFKRVEEALRGEVVWLQDFGARTIVGAIHSAHRPLFRSTNPTVHEPGGPSVFQDSPDGFSAGCVSTAAPTADAGTCGPERGAR